MLPCLLLCIAPVREKVQQCSVDQDCGQQIGLVKFGCWFQTPEDQVVRACSIPERKLERL